MENGRAQPSRFGVCVSRYTAQEIGGKRPLVRNPDKGLAGPEKEVRQPLCGTIAIAKDESALKLVHERVAIARSKASFFAQTPADDGGGDAPLPGGAARDGAGP